MTNRISTGYQFHVLPPAPFASVSVRTPDGAAAVTNLPAQVDTAADRTVLPQSVVDGLALVPIRQIQLIGFGVVPASFPVYLVTLALPTFAPISVEVTAAAGEPWVLLGRDVLNRYAVTLDGPNLRLTISEGP